MTLQTQQPTSENAPAILTNEQRRRVADALESAQSENTRRNYAGQYRKFRAWCEREEQIALPASPEVVAAYAAELVDDSKSMSTVRLAVVVIVDAHRRVSMESPHTDGTSKTMRDLSRRIGVGQKQARPLAAIRETALNPRKSRAARLSRKRLPLGAAGWTSRWRRFCLARACGSPRLPVSGGGTSLMPRMVPGWCTSSGRKPTRRARDHTW